MTNLNDLAARMRAAERDEDLEALDALADYFVAAERAPAPLAPAIRLDKRRIDDHVSAESDKVLPLANAIERARRGIRYRRLRRDGYDGPVVVSEGDSWFQYPFLIHDAIDWLIDPKDGPSEPLAVLSLGAGGDTLAGMVAEAEYVRALERERPDAFLFSAGGNDMLGDGQLARFLVPWTAGAEPADAIDDAALGPFLDGVEQAIETVLRDVARIDPRMPVVMHGYDYAQPTEGGPWLGTPLAAAKVPKTKRDDVIRVLLDRYNARLAALAGRHRMLEFVDCRGLVAKGDWKDELHPESAAFEAVADALRERIGRPAGAARTPDATSFVRAVTRIQPHVQPAAGAPVLPSGERLIDAGALLRGRAMDAQDDDVPGSLGAMTQDADGQVPVGAHPCSSLAAWRAYLGPEDEVAFAHYKALRAELHEPDDEARLRTRQELSAGSGLRSIERILGHSNIFPISYLAKGARAARAVGRISIVNEWGIQKGHGTGFLVAPGLLLTNNHVLPSAATARNSYVLFGYEYDADGRFLVAQRFALDPSLFVTDEGMDFALVGVAPRSERGEALDAFGHLKLIRRSGKAIKKEYISIIQHGDGLPKQIAMRDSYVLGRRENWIYYTTDTNPGSSGAPVVNDEWLPVALHHRTVPDFDTPCSYVANRGVRISCIFEGLDAAAGRGDASARRALALLNDGEPSGLAAPASGGPAAGPSEEAARMPWHKADRSDRAGYDAAFLGRPLPMPQVADPDRLAPLLDGTGTELRYQHFSILMDRHRRLAAVTAANVHADPRLRRPEPGRSYTRRGLAGLGRHDRERWFADPRLSPAHQLTDRFFTQDGGAFDRGHLVRRAAVAWGDSYDELRTANGDSYHVTNCAPQVAGFNRAMLGGLWGRLEDHVFAEAETERLAVFAGPVLDPEDRVFDGTDGLRVAIPRAYWKVIVAREDDALRAFAFLLEQDLDDVPLEFDPGADWAPRLVDLAVIEARAGLRFPPLHPAMTAQ